MISKFTMARVNMLKSSALIISQVLKQGPQVSQVKFTHLFDSLLTKSTTNNLSSRVHLRYCFSQSLKNSQTTHLNQQTQVVSQQQQQQTIIDVNATKSTMLFMDTNRLSTLVRMNRIRNSLKAHNYRSNSEKSIFSPHTSQNKQQLSSFSQFDKRILTITRYNQYLARGSFSDYNDYPMIKLLQICLKFLTQHHSQPHTTLYSSSHSPYQHWKLLQHLIRKRMHNCSSKDYLKIVFITLNAYNLVYKFTPQFIESLISGLRKEVPLMEEQELMQMFLVVSQGCIRGRINWESSLRFSSSSGVTTKTNNYRVKSPFFEHQLLSTLHHEILQKIVKRYQNKFMNTELAMKEQELFKLLWWAQTMIAYRNQSIGHIRDNTYSNLRKNKFLVGMVNVLTSKLHPQLKKTMTHVIKGQLRQIESKQVVFKSISEMIRFFQCLGEVRDYLLEEGKKGVIYEGIDEKAKEIRLRADTWKEKSKEVNDIMVSVLEYNSVKQIISGLFSKKNEQIQAQGDNYQKPVVSLRDHQQQMPEVSLRDYQQQWRLIEIIDQCQRYDAANGILVSNQWYIRVINEFRVIELLQKTQQLVQSQLNNKQLGSIENKRQKISLSDRERLIRLGQTQVNMLYKLFNNQSLIKKQLQSMNATQALNILNNANFTHLYSSIITTYFYLKEDQDVYLQKVRQQGIKLIEMIRPQTVLNMINFQIGTMLNEIDKKNSFGCVGLIIGYSKEMMGTSIDQSQCYQFMYYIRQLQFPIYNYLTHYLTTSLNINSSLHLTATHLATTLLTRNTLTHQYLQQHNPQYQQSTNPQTHNPFITSNKFISTNNYKALATSHGLTPQKHKLLQGDSLYSKENILMGEYIMQCVKQERKGWLRDENMVRLNKFFTQIKAFKEIRFCYPVTAFMACPQFVVVLEPTSHKDRNKNSSQLLKALYFLSKQLILQTQLLSLKEMYKLHGIELTVIEVNQFLDMHINQRIQTLNKAIFGQHKFNNTRNQSHSHMLQETIIHKVC